MPKYKNTEIVTADGKFDSKKEYQRWLELKVLERAGHIRDLRRQVSYELIPAQYESFQRFSKRNGDPLKDGRKCIEKRVTYVADFVYHDNILKRDVVEDTKGFRTDDYVIKRKLMLWVHGIRIYET
jgi:hypothetical protein